MGQLTQTMIAQITNFRADLMAALTTDLNEGQSIDAVTVTGTALSLSREVSEIAVSGTMALTLAAPTYVTQRKRIRAISAASTPAATLTITGPDTTAGFVCPATFFFDTIGQEIQLEATSGLLWRATRVIRAGGVADNVVVGTTAITNKLWARYCVSATGSVSSALPNGAAIGERALIIMTTKGLGGSGLFTGLFSGGAAVAYTNLGAFDSVATTTATGDMALLEWNGAAWVVMYQSGTTLS